MLDLVIERTYNRFALNDENEAMWAGGERASTHVTN